MTTRWTPTIPLLVIAGLLGACAQQVGDIDRTQPNRIEKSALDGEWYYRQTVVDVNGSATSTFVALQADMSRVVFDIEEQLLLVRRVDEDIIGVDNTVDRAFARETAGEGVVASFPISSHFDIIRNYNASTGEQTNVISENMSDRPWFERDFIRVNWTRNNIDTAVDPIIPLSSRATVSIAPQEHDGTWFVERDEDGNVTYIDVLHTYILTPDWLGCVLRFGFPLYGGWCGTETVTVRTSMMRILEDSDYEPRIYTDLDMNRFGFFRTERQADDMWYGTSDSNRIDLANRWNIWLRSTDDNGNRLPYAERDVRPLVFYASYPFPEDLIAPSYEVAEQWSFAFRRTVAAMQGVEFSEVPRMFYFCLNPGGTDLEPSEEFASEPLTLAAFAASNEGYAEGWCRDPGKTKNLGDLRYSFFNWIDHRQRGPLGYGPSSADPLTGEIVNANANMYGQAVNWFAQYTLDLVNIINGRITAEEFGLGRVHQQYFEALRERADGDIFFGQTNKDGERISLGTIEIDRQFRADRRDYLAEMRGLISESPRFLSIVNDGLHRLELRNEQQRTRLPELQNTPIERALITPEIKEALSAGRLRAGDHVDDEMLEVISPLRTLTLEAFHRIHDRTHRELLSRSIHFADDFDGRMLAFARRMAVLETELTAQYGDDRVRIDNLLRREIRRNIYRSVQEHEVGHTVGLRHNFEASMDSMNYFPAYWALREELTFNEDCDDSGYRTFDPTGLASGTPAGQRCGEGAGDLANRQAQVYAQIQERGIWDYTYASIMDYGQIVNAFAGLGLYDYAAIAYGYGDLVEVWNRESRPYRALVEERRTANDSFDSANSRMTRSNSRVRDIRGGDVAEVRRFNSAGRPLFEQEALRTPWTYWHYSILPIMFDQVSTPPEGHDTDAFIEARGLWPTSFNMSGVNGMWALYDRELVPRRDAVENNRVQVPYRFCSDEYRGSSAYCSLWDTGADEYEVFVNLRDQYRNYYMIEQFRRGRSAFGLDILSLYTRLLGRTMYPALNAYQYWLINASSRGPEWYIPDYAGGAAFNAAIESINFLGEVVTTPSPGTYAWNEREGTFFNISETPNVRPNENDTDWGGLREDQFLDLSVADGARFGATRFRRQQDPDRPDMAPERGYYAFLQYEVLSHFWAKLAGITALTSGYVDVVGADTSSDASAFFIPAFLVFGDDLTRFFGSLINEDFSNVGWCATQSPGQDRLTVRPIDVIRTGRACTSGRLLNPYTHLFGNRDFNMRLFTTVYAASELSSNLDLDWINRSAIFLLGRGEQPDSCVFNGGEDDPDCNAQMISYTDKDGFTYVAMAPRFTTAATGARIPVDPLGSRDDWHSGWQMVQRAIDLQVEVDNIRAEEGETGEFFRTRNRLHSHVEMMRFALETNHHLGTMWNQQNMWPRWD